MDAFSSGESEAVSEENLGARDDVHPVPIPSQSSCPPAVVSGGCWLPAAPCRERSSEADRCPFPGGSSANGWLTLEHKVRPPCLTRGGPSWGSRSRAVSWSSEQVRLHLGPQPPSPVLFPCLYAPGKSAPKSLPQAPLLMSGTQDAAIFFCHILTRLPPTPTPLNPPFLTKSFPNVFPH